MTGSAQNSEAKGSEKILIRYEGIKLRSEVTGHESWGEILSMQWGVGKGIDFPQVDKDDADWAKNRSFSAPSVSEIVITRVFDPGSAGFMREVLGTRFSTVALRVVNGKTGQVVLEYVLDNVSPSGYSISCGEGRLPHESVSLNFSAIRLDIPAAKERVTYDIGLNKLGS